MTSIDWEKFAAPESTPSKSVEWEQFKSDAPESESNIHTAARVATGTAARMTETYFGRFGNVQDLVENVLISGAEKIAGEELPTWRRLVKGTMPEGTLGTRFPNSEKFHEFTKNATGESLEPKQPWEKNIQETASDFTALASPLGVGNAMSIPRALGISLAANATKEGAHFFLGAGEGAQAATKMGTMFMLSMINPGGSGAYIRNLYQTGLQQIPQNAMADATILTQRLQNIQRALQRGFGTPSENAVARPLNELIQRSADNNWNIPVHDLVSIRTGINEVAGAPELRRYGAHFFQDMVTDIDATMNRYAQANPGAPARGVELFQDATRAYHGVAEGQRVSDNMMQWIKNPPLSAQGASLLFFGTQAGVMGLGATAQTGGAVLLSLAAARQAARLYTEMARSPSLRRYYMGVINNALNENAGAAVKNFHALDKGLKKASKKEDQEK